MQVEDIHIVSLQPLERRLKTELHRRHRIAAIVDRDLLVVLLGVVRAGELGREDDLITHAALDHPFADPFFRLALLVDIGRVEEAATVVVEVVYDVKGSLLGNLAVLVLLLVAKSHAAET